MSEMKSNGGEQPLNKDLHDHNLSHGNNKESNSTTGKEYDVNETMESHYKMSFGLSDFSDVDSTERSESIANQQSNTLEEGLYDGDIAEIYIGNGVESVGKIKNSEGSDSNLSEMTNSFGPLEDVDIDRNTHNLSPNKKKEHLLSDSNNVNSGAELFGDVSFKQTKQTDSALETRKRPLSPDGFIENMTESKRVKSEPVTDADSSLETQSSKANNIEEVIDLCPPVAVVAPLGFCEDIFIDDVPLSKSTKVETNGVKNDISSILDSLDHEDDKGLSMFDSVFEKMKNDIIAGQSFKTLDDGKWTFNGKPSACNDNENEVIPKALKVENNDGINEKENVLTIDESKNKNSNFKRTNSVEHDIQDFEKVLNSVIANASRFPKASEGIVQKMSNKHTASSGKQHSVHSKQCKQPCNHVSNSDLLRELLDQKTENNDTQTKTRQEIDLSFLHSDLVSGKGLSVSSDKILQTRTIDPRLTSIPHVERVSNGGQGIDQVKPGVDTRDNNQGTIHKSSALKLLEGDNISLAEQRRASVTLHHKVPPQSLQRNSVSDVCEEGSSIIKDAFDFATEISELTNDENEIAFSQSSNSMSFDSRQQLLTVDALNSHQNNENYLHKNSNFNKSLKIDPMQNQQMIRNPRIQEMRSGSGLLTFATPIGVPTSESNMPPQLAGPFMNSPENPASRPHDIRQQHGYNQRAAIISKMGENIPAHGNRLMSTGNEMQSYKASFEHIQNTSMVHTNQMKPLPMGQMETLRSANLAQRQTPPYMSHNNGYQAAFSSRSNQGPRSNMSELGLHPHEKVSDYRFETHMSMGHMSRGAVPPENNNYSMGMQERIRAMNVQQWYRRRMQAQMTRQVNPQSQMMRQPMPHHPQGMGSHMMTHGQGMGMHQNMQNQEFQMRRHMYQGNGSGSMVLPDQGMESRLRAMQSQAGHINSSSIMDNQRLQGHAYSQGQDQNNFEAQNLKQIQYGQLTQHNKIADTDAVNSMFIPRPFSADGMMDNTKSNSAPLGELSQQFDVKRETYNSPPAQDMFPFNI